jgi:hypothetical protein
MIAEFLAGLRGFLGSASGNISHPLILLWLLLCIYVLWLRIGRA